MKENKISKTVRILSIFHLFRFCKEVSYKEITGLMPVSTKTVERDISLLRQADIIRVRFSKKAGAFVPLKEGERMVSDEPYPELPDYKPQKLYLEKLIRLTTLMRKLDDAEDPVQWYKSHYPALCTRTMQRDFKTLCQLGYNVKYQREEEDYYVERQRGKYYCEFPGSTDGVTSFHW